MSRKRSGSSQLRSGLIHEIMQSGPQLANDWAEAAAHIHALQRMLMSQAAARAYPHLYRRLGEDFNAPDGY